MTPFHTPSRPLITFDKIAVRLGSRLLLPDTSWEIRSGQHWAVVGRNGAGKSSLVRALSGDVPIVRGTVVRHPGAESRNAVGYVSFELHRRLIAQEEGMDDARFFSGNVDHLTTMRRILAPEAAPAFARIVSEMEIAHLLDRPIRFLSTGEMRKMLIARAVMKSPRLLVLDEPFDGLDTASRTRLAAQITGLMNGKMQVILVTHRAGEILPPISHILCVENGTVAMQGRREDVIKSSAFHLRSGPLKREMTAPALPKILETGGGEPVPSVLIRMKNVRVRYGADTVLDGLNWTVRQGENWGITGPNGAGKTTLLRMVAGDHPQAYANEIYLFGRRRGTGESIWEIRRHIGLVSCELQIRYRKALKAEDVVVSGFFDSVGLYRRATAEQREIAREWVRVLGIEDRASRRFDQLSCGEQRMVLLARSVVRSPRLLILDEPCQGLDSANRERVIALADRIGRNTRTQIIYVTHHPDEMPACVTCILRLPRADAPGDEAGCGERKECLPLTASL
ncbi:hypothetical protein DENIS_0854 [Desulfonema ishimotonii]|uniref:ABC transporter domain-containing protein n=1 Tax=Desulfonema ishimotonii TaxID=45657 RepID=A0A401FSF7_9BACT|nr:ATP-binding cassette domain-containing protein [Desulfonema ishimotonii]GBC59912.1 hypothetical protein DENIS_0854 [Desulfonema ishimotonii]